MQKVSRSMRLNEFYDFFQSNQAYAKFIIRVQNSNHNMCVNPDLVVKLLIITIIYIKK